MSQDAKILPEHGCLDGRANNKAGWVFILRAHTKGRTWWNRTNYSSIILTYALESYKEGEIDQSIDF